MKITLNLLPKNKEKKIRNRKILRFIIVQEMMIIFVTVFLFGLILGIDKLSEVRLNEVNSQLTVGGNSGDFEKIKKYEDSILKIKGKSDFVSKIQKSNISWAGVLNKLPDVLPAGVILNSISNEGYSLLIGGVANNRDILVKTKQSFENDSCFKNVDIPLNDIVLKNNIEFELKLEIDKNCLK